MVPRLRISRPFRRPPQSSHAAADALLVNIQPRTTSMNNLHGSAFRDAPEEAFLNENLLRVLAIGDGGDNSLYFQASRSNSFAGCWLQ